MLERMSRRATVVVALFAGAVFGSSASGCAFIWLGVAHADGSEGQVIDVPCNVVGPDITNPKNPTTMWAVASFPGRSRFDLAANAYRASDPTPSQNPTIVQGITYQGASSLVGQGLSIADESVALQCGGGPGCGPGQCPGPASIQLYVR